MLCAEEGNTTEPNSSRYTVRLADIKPKVTPGEYRLVVFTAKKNTICTIYISKIKEIPCSYIFMISFS